MLFLGSLKVVLRKFQGCLKKVSSVSKKISLKVSRIYQESLNEVSIAISLHESHRSYPSRRRACYLEGKQTKLSDNIGIWNLAAIMIFFATFVKFSLAREIISLDGISKL